MDVPAIRSRTFYVKFGDILSRLAIAGTILLLVWSLIATLLSWQKRKQRA
jgi:hypothetical protein